MLIRAIASKPDADRLGPIRRQRPRSRRHGGNHRNYEGIVTISDKAEPTSYKLMVEGQGRPGFVKGTVTTTLREVVSESGGANTIVDVNGTAQTGGTIARLGQRLIASAAKMMQDRFFACMQSKL